MRDSFLGASLLVASLCGLFVNGAAAHPASGILVTAKGEVFFIHTGKGVCKIDTAGKLTYIHKVKGGGHFLAWDSTGRFSSTVYPRLFERITAPEVKPALLYASGGAPFVVSSDEQLYYGSGFPEGDDLTPGGLTLTRLAPNGKRTLFAPRLKPTLAKLNEAVTGLATGPDGSLFVACPNAILKVTVDGTVTTVVHPVVVKDRADDLAKELQSPFYHSPYLRGLDVANDGTIYAAVTGCRSVVKITADRKVETVLKAEKPWSPTGVAVRGKEVFVLEYSNHDKAKDWLPRVRKWGPEGKVTILATVAPDENKREP